MMRRFRPAVLLAASLFFGTASLPAQHLPAGGCRAAASCAGPRGFSLLRNSSGGGNLLFSVGASYAGRLSFRVVRPARPEPSDTRAVEAAVALFLKRHPLKGAGRPDGATGTKPQNSDRPRP
jgi:hypothetical protein